VHLGIDEADRAVRIELAERMVLIGGEPGGGKSGALNLIVGHAALSLDCRLVLVDGKQVELGAWRDCADEFVGPDIDHANKVLAGLRQEMDDRYDALLDAGRRKVSPESGVRYWPRAASLAVFGRPSRRS
jgi:S-DNA-T family DNA segregation ATPase FtsK/SpoIIIE